MAPGAVEETRSATIPPPGTSESQAAVHFSLRQDDRTATLESVLQAAHRHWRSGQLDEAVACAERVFELAATDKCASVLRIVGNAVPLLDTIFEERTGDADAKLLPGPRLAELRRTLSTHAGRLVAFVVGPTSVGDLLAMSNMPRRDGIRMIAGLLRRGALTRAPSP
jgi:hypothetical protein